MSTTATITVTSPTSTARRTPMVRADRRIARGNRPKQAELTSSLDRKTNHRRLQHCDNRAPRIGNDPRSTSRTRS